MTKKLLKIAVLCFALIFLYNYFFSRNHWREVRGQGLASSGETLTTMKFISTTVGFIGGDSFADIPATTIIKESKTFIYRTEDGGLSWNKSYLYKGAVEQIENVEGVIYVLTRVHTEESFRNLKSEIWKSEDLGKTWQLVFATQLPIYLRNIQFYSKNYGTGIFTDQSNEPESVFISKTNDGGKTWEKIKSSIDITNFGEIQSNDYGLVYVSNNAVKSYDINKKVAKTLFESSEKALFPVMSKDINGNIWLAASIADTIKLMKVDNCGNLTVVNIGNKVKMGDPYSLHVEGNSISLFVRGHSSILGSDHDFFHSDNAGVSWEKEKIPFDLKVKPISYFGTDHVWAGSGAGSIKIRRPTK